MEEAQLLKIIGGNIASIRKEMGLSQMQLSSKCNMDKANIVRIENGKGNPTISTLVRISNALNVSPFLLLAPAP